MISSFLKGFIPTFILLFLFISLSDVVVRSRYLTTSNTLYLKWAKELPKPEDSQWNSLVKQALERIDTYEKNIDKTFMMNGMLINRLADGTVTDICDSILFSSLHYVAIKKLNFDEKAEASWNAILRNQKNGRWTRDPSCDTSTSRDMIIGLFAAFSQNPDKTKPKISEFLNYVSENRGFFSKGPIYLSLMTPQLLQELKYLAHIHQIEDFPFILDLGLPTLEWESIFLNRGYESHLQALHVWLEMELVGSENFEKNKVLKHFESSLINTFNLFRFFTYENISQQRLRWITYRLVQVDPRNLFFRWLQFKANGLINRATRERFLAELLTMPQFPESFTPRDCDRKADYLWQRDSREYLPTQKCNQIYNGSDFIWMASLILEDDLLNK